MALREYQEGLVIQTTQEYEGRIAMTRSDAQRQADRLAWAEGMSLKGYLSAGQLLTERQTLAKTRHELSKAEGELRALPPVQFPKEIRALAGRGRDGGEHLRVAADRLKAEEDHLAHIRKQIANCIIRAPQDGVVVHANRNRWWAPPLQPGSVVYQDQEMFMLPDLTQMEVEPSRSTRRWAPRSGSG